MDTGNNGPAAPSLQEREFIFQVRENDVPVRLDRFLAKALQNENVSREEAKRLILAGKTQIDGNPVRLPRHALAPGSTVRIRIPAPQRFLIAEKGSLAVLYRDAALAVIDKPAGLTVHPAPGQASGTLAHRLISHFPELAGVPGFRPGIVHRLDKDTSGLMLVALHEKSASFLVREFSGQKVRKQYLALVHGVPRNERGVIDAPIGRSPGGKTRMAVTALGKSAKSSWETLYADPGKRFALVCVRIHTGRTHQVRVHMQHIGHPLVGDALYGPGAKKSGGNAAPRQMLHAWRLAFTHPVPALLDQALLPEGASVHNDTISFCCPPPEDFSETVRRLAVHMQRVVLTGSPGCGKSLLLSLLHERYGFSVFSADKAVAELYAPGGDGQQVLFDYFGSRFVPDPSAPVDKQSLARAMRREPALRREVEELLHPLVRHALERFWEEREQSGDAFAVAEVPLYLESGWPEAMERGEVSPPVLVGVHCPYALRKERLLRHRRWDAALIKDVESWQWPEEKKMRACDIVVDNIGSAADLAARLPLLFAELRKKREREAEAALSQLERIWGYRRPADAV